MVRWGERTGGNGRGGWEKTTPKMTLARDHSSPLRHFLLLIAHTRAYTHTYWARMTHLAVVVVPPITRHVVPVFAVSPAVRTTLPAERLVVVRFTLCPVVPAAVESFDACPSVGTVRAVVGLRVRSASPRLRSLVVVESISESWVPVPQGTVGCSGAMGAASVGGGGGEGGGRGHKRGVGGEEGRGGEGHGEAVGYCVSGIKRWIRRTEVNERVWERSDAQCV